MVECITFNLTHVVWKLQRKHGCTFIKYAIRDHGDEGWDSKVGEDALSECGYSDTFYAIVETDRSSKRVPEGPIINPLE
jgi:hypothetical protein